MAYVRTVSYTFPYQRIERLQVGTDLWLRLVSANKLIAQESEGMLDTGVWMTQQADGSLRVVSYTEWYNLDNLKAFNDDPDVRHHETELGDAAMPGTKAVDVYETLG